MKTAAEPRIVAILHFDLYNLCLQQFLLFVTLHDKYNVSIHNIK